jgi:hypothetical protein
MPLITDARRRGGVSGGATGSKGRSLDSVAGGVCTTSGYYTEEARAPDGEFLPRFSRIGHRVTAG